MNLRIVGAMRVAVAAGTAVIVASVASAQPAGQGGGGRGGPGGPGGAFGGRGFGMLGGMMGISPTLTKEDLDQYEQMLHLTDDQKQSAQRVFDAYEERVKTDQDAAREAARQAFQDAGDSGDRTAAMKGVLDTAREFGQNSTKMEQSFFDQFKGVLTPEQLVAWPRVERARRREKAADSGVMAGSSAEKIDLVKAVDGLNLSADARAGVDPVLDQYEQDLDRELVNREKANEELGAARNKEIEEQNGRIDFRAMMEKLQPFNDKVQEAGAKAADVNQRYAAKIQTVLPEDRRAGFLKAVKRQRFADVYQATQMGNAFDAALALEDLEDGQKAKIKSLKSQYERSLDSVNTRLAAAMEKAEATPAAGPGPAGMRRFRDPAMRDLRREKSDLDQETYTKLKAVLAPEQVAKVPKVQPPFQPQRPPPGQGGGQRQRGGG